MEKETILNQIPQEFIEKFHINIMGLFLRIKGNAIYQGSITDISVKDDNLVITVGTSLITLYPDGTMHSIIF